MSEYRWAITPSYRTFGTRHEAVGELAIARRLIPFDFIVPSLVVFEEGDDLHQAIETINAKQDALETITDNFDLENKHE